MMGLTSFEINSNSTMSVISDLKEGFQLQVGPASQECVINHLTISYVILSVFTRCGSCIPYTIELNGKCVEKCPENFLPENGTCKPLTCRPNFYLLEGKCSQCPIRSNIPECNNSCLEGEKLVGETCISICAQPNEKYSYGQCICLEGYFRIRGSCASCPLGTRFNGTDCESICSVNGFYDLTSSSCKCNPGFHSIHGRCISCAQGQ